MVVERSRAGDATATQGAVAPEVDASTAHILMCAALTSNSQSGRARGSDLDIEDFERATRALRQQRHAGGKSSGDALAYRARELVGRAHRELAAGTLGEVDARLIRNVRDELEEALSSR